jgi:hypothetical protein
VIGANAWRREECLMKDTDARENAAGPLPAYSLGHSDRELERLRVQARLIDPITRRFFVDAGIAPGMRVLDVGSGVGNVAFLAAELVEPPARSSGRIEARWPSPSRGNAPKRARCPMCQ